MTFNEGRGEDDHTMIPCTAEDFSARGPVSPGACSLEDLGRQYAREAEVLDGLIEACRQRRRFAMRSGNAAEAQRQERLMELHQGQRNDLRRIAVWLKRYYVRPEAQAETAAPADTAAGTKKTKERANIKEHVKTKEPVKMKEHVKTKEDVTIS
ncbi:MAG: hypothetical protein FWH26_06420 [Oscillospiraceae bacterium]|nr:hypothetical protein [Oscillospiraceae bacterium]